MSIKFTILGSGTSTGVPQIGCTCPVCTSTDPRDRRMRCSSFIETDITRILLDCGPDFYHQSLRYMPYEPLSGVLISHEHFDHVGGIDDLRAYCHLAMLIYMPMLLAQLLFKHVCHIALLKNVTQVFRSLIFIAFFHIILLP